MDLLETILLYSFELPPDIFGNTLELVLVSNGNYIDNIKFQKCYSSSLIPYNREAPKMEILLRGRFTANRNDNKDKQIGMNNKMLRTMK